MNNHFPLFEKAILDYVFVDTFMGIENREMKNNYQIDSLYFNGYDLYIGFSYKRVVRDFRDHHYEVLINFIGVDKGIPIRMKFLLIDDDVFFVKGLIGATMLKRINNDMVSSLYTFLYPNVSQIPALKNTEQGDIDSLLLKSYISGRLNRYNFYNFKHLKFDVPRYAYSTYIDLTYKLILKTRGEGRVQITLDLDYRFDEDDYAILGEEERKEWDRLIKNYTDIPNKMLEVSGYDLDDIMKTISSWLKDLAIKYNVPYDGIILP